jgi:archaellum biogenesis ATPase FlaH
MVDSPKNRNNLYGVYLGYPFDQLLNQNCVYLVKTREQRTRESLMEPLGTVEKTKGIGRPGIVLPDDQHPGTGNIVISGPPGSAKSTLALQFAVACTHSWNMRAFPIYLSLENTPEEVRAKAEPFGWEDRLRIVHHLHSADEFATPDGLGKTLLNVLTQSIANGCPFHGKPTSKGQPCKEHYNCYSKAPESLARIAPYVLLASLSPRPLAGQEVKDTVFWTRYKQLERLLSAASSLRQRLRTEEVNCRWILPLVVVDSLNMLAVRPLDRNEIVTLFSLFRQHQTVGVFTVESTLDTPFDSTLADVVISLDMPDDNSYSVRQLKVVKSRYQNQVYGWHPFRMGSFGNSLTPQIAGRDDPDNENGAPSRHGVVVYPSLHYVVLRSGEDKASPSPKESPWEDKPGTAWGIEALNHVLPDGLRKGSTILVEGPRGTFKTNLAMTFLAKGLLDHKSGLLIRLHDSPMLVGDPGDKSWPILSEEIERKFPFRKGKLTAIEWPEETQAADKKAIRWQHLIDPKKAAISVWEVRDDQARLFEVDFKSGALLPEELVQVVWDIIIRQKRGQEIGRVVLDDVSEIGAAYPFLRKSSTSGDSFLPALAHVMRNNSIELVVTGTTSDLPEGDEAVGRIRAVADTVVSTRYLDVFGKRHVVIQGEGLTVHAKTSAAELGKSVPPIIRVAGSGKRRMFRVDAEYLEGLVGFETGNVHRPGVSLHLFESRGISRRYNQEIALMLRAAFAEGTSMSAEGDGVKRRDRSVSVPAVTVLPFDSVGSMAMHDSLQVFQKDEPLNETVICTVDEFWSAGTDPDHKPEDRFVQFDSPKRKTQGGAAPDERVRRYYKNVLLLAYRQEDLGINELNIKSWAALKNQLANIKLKEVSSSVPSDEPPPVRRKLWFDRFAPETLSCALIDALKSGAGRRPAAGDWLKFHEIVRLLGTNGVNRQTKVDEMASELAALHELLCMTGSSEQTANGAGAPSSFFLGDAGVYLCWYSQLRELIKRLPVLAKELKVCALPAGGFSGDWYIGIVKGSVSPALGQRIIQMLCRKQEDYKRFARGVGLPADESFQGHRFNAWPRATVKLDKVLDIHRDADLRSKIKGYGKIRLRLYNMARQLTRLVGPPLNTSGGSVENQIKEIVLDRLPEQLKVLGYDDSGSVQTGKRRPPGRKGGLGKLKKPLSTSHEDATQTQVPD